jgi:ABC-2 type transport system ATP-binding protein
MKENSILVHDLCKKLSDFNLDHVSFKVPTGRIVGFIGENGAGKSTTINLILNELKKDVGKIEVFEMDNTKYSIKYNIGVVFDECNFYEVFNVHEWKITSAESFRY